ncbi:DsrE family protein [Maribacter sp. 2308TA10-17]|uniref:DsrE family protein n=1 Tax=Maribacter sp. 2308TA10-17 TaxID=3386276 RepID=UPI0039BC59C8
MKRIYLFAVLVGLLSQTSLTAQTKETGPIIKDYGKVWAIDNPDFKVDPSKEYKAVFDIMNSPENHESVNATIETAARFLNMHAQSGIPAENLKVALVVHNKASKDVITSEAYQKKYGTDNPNQELIKALMDAGGQIIFCGQSSLSRGFPREDLIEGVQLSLSAMTALIQLQDEDFRLIKF